MVSVACWLMITHSLYIFLGPMLQKSWCVQWSWVGILHRAISNVCTVDEGNDIRFRIRQLLLQLLA